MNDNTARVSVVVKAPVAKAWEALTNPEKIKKYMFGTNVLSDWKEGSSIVWQGEWQGKKYEDKGMILQLKPERRLQYTHYSPTSGADVPENYHTVTVELSEQNGGVLVELSQDNNPTPAAREHSEKNWAMMLGEMKKFLEA